MPVESDGHNEGNPRMYELIENAPKTGKSPTVWAFPQFVEYLKVAGQPVQGPWPPHQEPRPDPTAIDSGPVAVPDPLSAPLPPATVRPRLHRHPGRPRGVLSVPTALPLRGTAQPGRGDLTAPRGRG